MAKRITKAVTKTALKFGGEQARTQWFERATPGIALEVAAPFLWITWKGETKGVPLSEVLHVEAEEVASVVKAKAS